MKAQKFENQGSALIYIIIVAAIGTMVLFGLATFIISQDKNSQRVSNREQAFQISESGIYWYRWYLAHTVEGKTVQQKKDFWASGQAKGVGSPYQVEVSDPEGGVIGKYKLEVTPPKIDSTIVVVKSTGWTYKSPNVTRTIQARFRQPAWCEYAVVANDFMRFGQGTETFGMIHSNKGIRFDGVADNVVSSAIPDTDDPDHTGNNEFAVHTHVNAPPQSGVNDSFRPLEAPPTNPVPNRPDIFKAGRKFPVPEKNFNTLIADLNLMKQQAGLYLGQTTTTVQVNCGNRKVKGQWVWMCDNQDVPVEGYHIILKTSPAHSMNISMVLAYDATSYQITSETAPVNYPIPANGTVFVENYTWVEGTLNGNHLTIAAADLSPTPVYKDIYINHNILYTDKVGNDADGPDILGLIAQNDISIGLYSDDNLEVDAALLAQRGRVGRDYYSAPLSPVDYVHRHSITTYGSIVTAQRYGFAWTDGTGYNIRNLYFDNNLIYYPPPFFPTGDKYQIDLWQEL